MFKRILVPVDGSETSSLALATAVRLARESGGCARIVHQFDEMDYLTGFEYGAQVLEQALASARKMVEAGVARAQAAGIAVDGRLLEERGRTLGEAVADEARAFEADLVVVGTEGRRGFSRALLGSGAEQVIRCAPTAVLAIRGSGPSADRPR